jgi:DNA invertase Pin-like site-specific DNA recombinase
MKVGYLRVAHTASDLDQQKARLIDLGVTAERIYVDRGYVNKNMSSSGLGQALYAVQPGDEFVVPTLETLGGNVSKVIEVIRFLVDRRVAFNIGGSLYDQEDPMTELFFAFFAALGEAQVAWLSLRSAEVLSRPEVQTTMKARPPRHHSSRDAAMLRTSETTDLNIVEIAEMFNTSRASVYRALERARAARPAG